MLQIHSTFSDTKHISLQKKRVNLILLQSSGRLAVEKNQEGNTLLISGLTTQDQVTRQYDLKFTTAFLYCLAQFTPCLLSFVNKLLFYNKALLPGSLHMFCFRLQENRGETLAQGQRWALDRAARLAKCCEPHKLG